MTDHPIYVVKPSLPPLEEFTAHLETIWEKGILTNGGPLHQQLEKELCDYLGVSHVSLFNNGTSALLAAVGVLDLTGEVITTPFSFVATAHAIVWNNLKPVFVDIDPRTMNIDPALVEAAITPQTSAILAVHCYGQPCDISALQTIADKHNLKLIYDAAHAFGMDVDGKSSLAAGDVSAISFHATKVFNTFEGGAVICHDERSKKQIDQYKNFGISSETSVDAFGFNGKMSEVNAGFGLVQLKYVDEAIQKRGEVDRKYREGLSEIEGLKCLEFTNTSKNNYSYFPIFVEDNYPLNRDELYEKLKEYNIFARKYFYPLITDFTPYKQFCVSSKDEFPNAYACAEKVMCLPIYPDLEDGDINRIISALKENAS